MTSWHLAGLQLEAQELAADKKGFTIKSVRKLKTRDAHLEEDFAVGDPSHHDVGALHAAAHGEAESHVASRADLQPGFELV